MADIADRAAEYQDALEESEIRLRKPFNEPGPGRCLQCGYHNDRANDGYAVCSDCFELMHGSGGDE